MSSPDDLIRRGDAERSWNRPDHYMYPPEEIVRMIRAIPAAQREQTPELLPGSAPTGQKPLPKPPKVHAPTPEEIAAMTLEQVAAETTRLRRECGVVGGISRCGTDRSTPEAIARGDLSALAIIARHVNRMFTPPPEAQP